MLTVWQDTKPVLMISTNWDTNNVVKVTWKKKDGAVIEVDCPKVVQLYNHNMGGVDKGDQYRRYYELRMKSRKFYKYIFWFMMEVCILNSYVLAQQSQIVKKGHFKDFRVELAKPLIGNYCGRRKRGKPVQLLPPPTPKKPNLAHFPVKKKSGRCAYCPTLGRQKESTWFCAGCNICLCHTSISESDCFVNNHIKVGIYE